MYLLFVCVCARACALVRSCAFVRICIPIHIYMYIVSIYICINNSWSEDCPDVIETVN
jgi:hypothetical protein